MRIISKLVEIEIKKPFDNDVIENKLREMGIEPLRWAITKCGSQKCKGNVLTISLACQDL